MSPMILSYFHSFYYSNMQQYRDSNSSSSLKLSSSSGNPGSSSIINECVVVSPRIPATACSLASPPGSSESIQMKQTKGSTRQNNQSIRYYEQAIEQAGNEIDRLTSLLKMRESQVSAVISQYKLLEKDRQELKESMLVLESENSQLKRAQESQERNGLGLSSRPESEIYSSLLKKEESYISQLQSENMKLRNELLQEKRKNRDNCKIISKLKAKISQSEDIHQRGPRTAASPENKTERLTNQEKGKHPQRTSAGRFPQMRVIHEEQPESPVYQGNLKTFQYNYCEKRPTLMESWDKQLNLESNVSQSPHRKQAGTKISLELEERLQHVKNISRFPFQKP